MRKDLYRTVVESARRIESALIRGYGASGKGLHQKLTNVERRVPPHVGRKIRFIATVRNKLLHEDGFVLEDRRGFDRTVKEVLRELKRGRRRRWWKPWTW